MLRFLTVFVVALVISSTARAQCISTWSRDCNNSGSGYGQGSSQSDSYGAGYNRDRDESGDRVSPYSPNQRGDSYRQEPTLGDPSSTRRTNPRRCTGLLCN